MTTLLVASTGGHLKELHHLRSRLPTADGPFRWVTFDTPQSRSLLDGEAVDFVRFVGDRDVRNTVTSVGEARRIMRSAGVEAVVSTGAAVALPFIGLARARRLECRYIESAARTDGPSLTGRMVSRIPGVRLFTQYRQWASSRWRYGGSVFDGFEPVERAEDGAGRLERVVVSLGTTRQVEFRRLLRRLIEVMPPEADVLWQTGNTDTGGLGIRAHRVIPERDLIEAMAEADTVVAHAGVGTALAALEAGRCPVLVPRRPERGELVDDHQLQIARGLAERGLSVSVEAERLTRADLLAASRRRVRRAPQAPPLPAR
jgi:UDP-N-acetylglucosamine--N-acetylmuramyl-(pentapeptide) pyrophosphoryl-undecaprenol N-acetylglucosamine transferase